MCRMRVGGKCKNVAWLLEIVGGKVDQSQPHALTISEKIMKIRDEKGVSSHIDVINWDTDTEMETKDMKFPIYIQIWNFYSDVFWTKQDFILWWME